MWGIGMTDGELIGSVHFFEVSHGKYIGLCNGIVYDEVKKVDTGYCHDCMMTLIGRVKHKLDTATPI